jgi:D-aspartate ligase
MSKQPIAVVVGLCAHGLAVARALARAGVDVVALETNRGLPGSATRIARVASAGTIRGDGLISTLVTLADRLEARPKPVLFLTNDRMVGAVGASWPELESRYSMSWSRCRDAVLRLIDKRNLEEHCRRSELAYPGTVVFDGSNLKEVAADLGPYPVLAKPSQPLGTFKAVSLADEAALHRLAEEHRPSLPFLVQQLIPGGDEKLKVAAFVMREGKVVAAFEGRKLRSQPPCRGQTSVMQPWADERVRAAGERFFAGLEISGPVSVEFKEAPDGELFVIEPTVGRTDYFVDACVANGCDLPSVEYAAVTGCQPRARRTPARPRIWCDTERDGTSFLRTAASVGKIGLGWLPIFPYLSTRDPGPFIKACLDYVRALPRRVWSWARRRSTVS